MKTITTLLIIISAFFCNQIIAQSKILKLNFGEEPNKWIMFPPTSKFILTDENKEIILTNESDYGKFVRKHSSRFKTSFR